MALYPIRHELKNSSKCHKHFMVAHIIYTVKFVIFSTNFKIYEKYQNMIKVHDFRDQWHESLYVRVPLIQD